MSGSADTGARERLADRYAQTIRGALWHGQGLGGHNNYRAAEDALAALLALAAGVGVPPDAARELLTKMLDAAWWREEVDVNGEYTTTRARGYYEVVDEIRAALAGVGEARPAAEYPRKDGDFFVLGPEIFTDAEGTVICWRGGNYVRQGEARPAEPPTEKDSVCAPAEEQPDARVELQTVVTEAAEDAIEDAVAAHDFNALASIAHTLRVALEASAASAPLAALIKERDMHDAMADSFADRAETAEAEVARLREQLDAALALCAKPIHDVEVMGIHVASTGNAYGFAKSVRAALGVVAAAEQTTDLEAQTRRRDVRAE